MVVAVLMASLLALAPASHASCDAPPPTPVTATTVALFVAGGVGAFVAHESGHLLANALLHNRPRFVPMWGFGFLPFFAISPELACSSQGCIKADGTRFGPGLRGKYLIVTAGFEMQHLTSELLLTQAPQLRRLRAPWRKGWLAFNIGLSVAYALTSVLHIEDSHGDAGGAAYASGYPRPVVAAWLIAPAALDLYRYLNGDSTWAPWMSRGVKAGFFSLAWTF